MPKVLRIINRFNLGGPTYNAAYLTSGLKPDYETLLIGGVNEDSETDSLHITTKLGTQPKLIAKMRRSINLINDYKAYREIRAIIKEFKPDIVHTHASKAGLLGRLAARKEKVPIIVHTYHGHVFHSYFGRFKTMLYKNTERYLAKKSSSIIAISAIQKNELSAIHKVCPDAKITVIPLGFELNRFTTNRDKKRHNFRKRYMLEEDEVAIGIIGRLVPIKNHQYFINAIAEVFSKSVHKVKVFIIGDGESREKIESLIKKKGIQYGDGSNQNDQIIFTSWIREIDEVMPAMDIVALTSLNEGTPVSLIEAQACSIPIVSTNVGGIADIVVNKKSAFLCSVNDTSEFAQKLLQLIKDNKLRAEMGTYGHNFVIERFQVKQLIQNMKSHYEKLLGVS